MTGTLHLLPVGLGDADPSLWLTPAARTQAAGLDCYIVENAKTARAWLKQIGTQHALPDITMHVLDRKTDDATMARWLEPLTTGADIGLMSEAGCPAVADPGARVVAQAHRLGLSVRPWTGPSSLLLGLMASGLDGQRFVFHGYAPIKPAERAARLRQWEQQSTREHQTQLLIETPYRNDAMWQTLVDTLRGDTRLCVARSLTTAQEWVCTRTVAQWRQSAAPELDRHPTVFLFQAA